MTIVYDDNVIVIDAATPAYRGTRGHDANIITLKGALNFAVNRNGAIRRGGGGGFHNND